MLHRLLPIALLALVPVGRASTPEPLVPAPPADAAAAASTAADLPARLALAVRERRVIIFNYSGLPRVLEPHACGVAAATGEPVLHGYQTEGGSVSGKLPGWRTFAVAGIRDLVVGEKTFTLPRPGYDAERPKLDPAWAEIASPAP